MKVKYLIIGMVLAIILASCKFGADMKPKTPVFQGYIESSQVNVTTRIPGRLVKIFVDEGNFVSKGDTVAVLDTREIRANREALVAKLKNIEVNKSRVEHLYKVGAVPQQKLDEITTGYDMLLAKIKALDIRTNDMTILAPMDGIINVKVLEENQMMPPGMPVVIETDPKGTWARFSIPETYLDQINLGDEFNLRTNTDIEFRAKVFQILPIADFATHTPTTLRDERDVRGFDVKMLITTNQLKCKPGMSTYLYLNPVKNNDTGSK
ncbi:efflux RND transporter periplasmic adaptor subunit [bacterium]|nr:efflux RND transporter periplasmic adaptor subunit [bacterium]